MQLTSTIPTSTAIPLILAVIAFRPINALVENLLEKRQQELLEQQQKEVELEKKVGLLESRNRELENRLDTRAQTEGMPSEIDFTFKLEQMEYAKKGYVVKEEPLEDYSSDERYKSLIPDVSLWNKMLETLSMKEKGIRKILYIKKYYYKVSIGIDFSKVKFSFDGDRILFSGVKFTRLHDISVGAVRTERYSRGVRFSRTIVGHMQRVRAVAVEDRVRPDARHGQIVPLVP